MHKLALIAALSVALAAPVQAADKVKVGFISTLSGPAAAIGTDIRDGFNLALKMSGGKLGGLPAELLITDDQQNPDIGKQAADKYLKRDHVDFVTGIVFSNVLLAVAPAVFENKTFLLSANAGPSVLAGAQCSPWFFSVAWQNEGTPEAAGKYTADKGFKSVFLISPNYPAGKDMVAGFKRFYKGTIADELYPRLGQLDFSAELAQIRAAHPGAVFFFLPGGMGINFVKQFAASGLSKETTLITTAFSADEDIIPAVGEPMLGIYNTGFWNHDLDIPESKAFVAAFEKEYGRLPSGYAAQGYEAARAIDAAVREVKGKLEDADALRAALRANKFKSVRGPFKINRNGFPIENFYLRVVERDAKGRITNRTLSVVLKDQPDPYVEQCPLK
ncbi:MAG TPA: ABC transporter substrate-binding protein [Burkholderiales bacterium]|nr:ABC transporter substrate-binding protein [Burkholderiales bacterium]